MSKALGLLEFTSISCGIDVCDAVIKAATTELLRAGTTCPGKYLVLITGETGDVRQAITTAKMAEDNKLIAEHCLPNCHPAILDALRKRIPRNNELTGAIALFEYSRVVSAIIACDLALKSAQVKLVDLKTGFGIGGKGFFILNGSVGDVRAAVTVCNNLPHLISIRLIPKPDSQLLHHL